MKYNVLKEVMIDGVRFNTGDTVEITHDKTARLVMLGFIEEVVGKSDRSVGLKSETKPRTRKKKVSE